MKTKYLIIGAGISGLTFASYCKENYLIIEKIVKLEGIVKLIIIKIMYGIMLDISFILKLMNLRKSLLIVWIKMILLRKIKNIYLF